MTAATVVFAAGQQAAVELVVLHRIEDRSGRAALGEAELMVVFRGFVLECRLLLVELWRVMFLVEVNLIENALQTLFLIESDLFLVRTILVIQGDVVFDDVFLLAIREFLVLPIASVLVVSTAMDVSLRWPVVILWSVILSRPTFPQWRFS